MEVVIKTKTSSIPLSANLPDLCCDNCIRKVDHAQHFKTIYDLIGYLDAFYGRDPISCPTDDDNSDLGSTSLPKTWGNLRPGNHLTIRRRILEAWRYNCWKRDYQLCSWGAAGVMSDPVLSMLALSTKIKTIGDLLEAISDWGYANEYGGEVLLLLKGADEEHQLESQARRIKTRQANKKRKLEDMERDEEQYNPGGSLGSSASTVIPLVLEHTRMIEPVVVKHVKQPTKSQPSRPQPRPVLTSRPYLRTDPFDSLMGI